MQASRHWLIGSAMGCVLAATLAVLTDAALPPAAPRPAPLPQPAVAPGGLSPFAANPAPAGSDLHAAQPARLLVAQADIAQTEAAERAAAVGPATDELQTLVDEFDGRPSADAELDRVLREALIIDVRQRLAQVRRQGGDAAQVRQLERLAQRLADQERRAP